MTICLSKPRAARQYLHVAAVSALSDAFRSRSPIPIVTPATSTRVRAIVDEFYIFVWRSLHRLGVGEMEVEDAAQDVLIVLNRRINEIAQGGEQRFLFYTCVHVAAQVRRKKRRDFQRSSDSSFDEVADFAPSPEAIASRNDAARVLDKALQAIPPPLRQVFILCGIEEITMNEAATLLNLPRGTVSTRLLRARASLAAWVRSNRNEDT